MRIRTLAAVALACAAALPAAAQAAPPRAFLQDAVAGDNGEVRLGRLAQRMGQSQGVRAFGRMLERDHAMARDQALAAARRDGVRVDPARVKPEALATERRLRRMGPRMFDREFVRAMREDHRTDIAKFEAQSRNGDRITARLASDTLPHLREHLRTAERLPG
jgi:putative membrane protein